MVPPQHYDHVIFMFSFFRGVAGLIPRPADASKVRLIGVANFGAFGPARIPWGRASKVKEVYSHDFSVHGLRKSGRLLLDMKFIDVHVHLDKLKTPFEEALASAAACGVTRVITIGTEPADHPVVLGYAKKYFPQVACTLGIHPHEAQLWSEDVGAWIRSKVLSEDAEESRGIVAVGEIGLDYYDENGARNLPSKDIQRNAFRRQMDLAEELGLPVEIHTRDADDDCAMILNEYRGRVTGLLHCFTSSMALAKTAVDCGFDISISGVVTFKNAVALREVVQFLPLSNLHVETDAPFLAPVPQRGKSNLPEFVLHTAQFVADLKGISLDELSRATRANAKRLFPKLSMDES